MSKQCLHCESYVSETTWQNLPFSAKYPVTTCIITIVITSIIVNMLMFGLFF